MMARQVWLAMKVEVVERGPLRSKPHLGFGGVVMSNPSSSARELQLAGSRSSSADLDAPPLSTQLTNPCCVETLQDLEALRRAVRKPADIEHQIPTVTSATLVSE